MSTRRPPGRSEPRSSGRPARDIVTTPAAIPARDSLFVGLAALAITLPLTPNVSGDKDAGEFALVLARFAAAHPTGYPLYTLMGGAFVHLLHALGVGWVRAANAWSAAGGAVAAALLHALAARFAAREGASRNEASLGGALATAAFVLHPLWTDATTQAEVHSWHVAWVLGAGLAALTFVMPRPEAARAHPRLGRPWQALVWGGIVGLGLAHHVTSVLVSIPLTLALVIARRGGERRAQSIAWFAAGAALPLLGYTFIAWRAFHPAPAQWGSLAPDWRSIFAHVTAREYRVYTGRFAPSAEERELIAQHVVPWLAVLVPAAIAWGFVARRTPIPIRLGVLAAIGVTLTFVRFYGVADPSAYLLPPLALTLGVTPALLAALPLPLALRRGLGIALAIVVAVAGVFGVRLALARNAAFRTEDLRVHRLWRALPAERGFVLWSDDRIAILRSYQLLRGEHPGVEIDHPLLLTQDWPRAQFVAKHGFDPVSRPEIAAAAARAHPRDVQELSALMAEVIALHIDTHSPLPVMVFLPESNEVRMLPKGEPRSH